MRAIKTTIAILASSLAISAIAQNADSASVAASDIANLTGQQTAPVWIELGLNGTQGVQVTNAINANNALINQQLAAINARIDALAALIKPPAPPPTLTAALSASCSNTSGLCSINITNFTPNANIEVCHVNPVSTTYACPSSYGSIGTTNAAGSFSVTWNGFGSGWTCKAGAPGYVYIGNPPSCNQQSYIRINGSTAVINWVLPNI